MPAFWLTTEEGRKAFDEYRFAFRVKTEGEWRRERRARNAKREAMQFAIQMEALQMELILQELQLQEQEEPRG
jgi:hypothetical protein